jgi:phage protein D
VSAVDAPVYVPDFALALDGLPLPAELRASVQSVHVEAAMEGADRLELSVANPDLRFLDRPPLVLGTDVALSLGYRPRTLSPLFTGELTGVEPTFPGSGMPSLSVSALGRLQRLDEGTKQRGFPYYLPDSVIATIIAAEHQLIALPDAAASVAGALNMINQRPRFQHKRSDHQFLRAIAAEYGIDMWVEGDQLNFRLLLVGLPAPERELIWGRSLLDFSPRLTSVGQVASITVRVWVEALKLQVGVEAAWRDDRLVVRVSPALFGATASGGEATLSIPDIPIDSPVDAVKWALGELRRRVNTRITARGTVIGDPGLRVGDVVAIGGVGSTFSGSTYRLTSVSHSLDGNGYRTTFDARKELI